MVNHSIKHIDLRYSDTDQMGVIYHAHYLSFFEQARTKFYKDAGFEYHETEQQGVIFPVRDVSVQYKRAVRFGEEIYIVTKIHDLSRVKVTYYHEMYNQQKELKATGYTSVVAVDKQSFKTVKIHEVLPDVYTKYLAILEQS